MALARRISRAVPGTSLLPVPFAIAAAILLLFAITLTLDAYAGAGAFTLPPWLSVGNIDDARVILGAILGTVSTVLALIFSVTLLVFSMAATQFGPRLIPYFLRQRTMQAALGLFLGTFLHSLATLVVTGQHQGGAFVPQITILTNVALVFVSFCYLVFYNHRVALAIQTNNVLARIVENLSQAIEELSQHAARSAQAGEHQEGVEAIRCRCLAEGRTLKSTTSGYVQTIDHDRVMRAADECGAIVYLAFRPGEFVLEGEVLAHVIPAVQAEPLTAAIHQSVRIGQHRTLEQDVEFAFAQLSEIAIRALSPAINDTYTGLSSIDWLGDALRMFAELPASNGTWSARAGQIHLFMPPLLFSRVVDTAFDLIIQAGTDNPAVIIRLLQTCSRLSLQLRDNEQRRVIRDKTAAIQESALAKSLIDKSAFEGACRLARERLGDV
jgi:uncharacterized membrane protein